MLTDNNNNNIYYRQMQNTNKDQSSDFIASFTQLVSLLGKFQNELQSARELLTLRNDFNPQRLYKYLTLGEQQLTKAHIMYFMQENNKPIRQQETKMLLTVYGYKDKLNYSDFLNYVYPFDVDTIKTISTVHCKKYIKNETEQPNEEILCIFLILLLKQMQFLHAFDDYKTQKLSGATRQSIKKWIKQLKKSVPQSAGGISSDYVFTFPEFKAILKKLKNLPQRKTQPICRRLSLQKQSFIGLDQLQVWLKPWFKQKQEETIVALSQNSQTLFEDIAERLIV